MHIQQSFAPYKEEVGALYLVPTPIGNLEDMTFRAIRILQEAALILAEDTRTTIKLLNHFAIDTPMHSFHEHSSPAQVEAVMMRLRQGDHVALVSDAGMPLINDPGHPLVQAVLAEGLAVVALPGANAALTALVASGLGCQQFAYYGFFPRGSKEQEQILQQVQARKETAIFYESPYRLKKSLFAIAKKMPVDTKVVVARELTKRYETYLRGTAAELTEYLANQEVKGECVLLIEGHEEVAPSVESWQELSLKAHVEQLMADEDISAKEAIKQVAKLRQLKKQEVYQAYHELGE
ncbi:16S rRNA (cytidine(1402)-2'-O)-methyltransferase [Aerococcaceae bacterium NML191219]|nr:16S rRNA (cytidine(1402)-2'-O)-methyltransferase [Aerococcaceae bacterium NML191219]